MSAYYQRVIDHITSNIDAGVYEPGVPLPSIAKLAQELGVGQTTVKSALQILRDRGIVRGQPGKATYPVGEPAAQDEDGEQPETET